MIINEALKPKLNKGKTYYQDSTRLGSVEVHQDLEDDSKSFIILITPEGRSYYYKDLDQKKAIKIGNNMMKKLEKYKNDHDVYGDRVAESIAEEYEMLPYYY